MRFDPQLDTSILAKYLQRTLRYVLEGFSKYVKSYNLFFYDINDGYHYLKNCATLYNITTFHRLWNSTSVS